MNMLRNGVYVRSLILALAVAGCLFACASNPADRFAQKATLLELVQEYNAKARAGEVSKSQAEDAEKLFVALKAARAGYAQNPTGSACEIAQTANKIAEILGKTSSLSEVDFCSDLFQDLERELEELETQDE